MKRPLYYLLCAIACTSMVSATMPMAAIAEATQPQATAEQQAQADATGSDTGKAEDDSSTNAAADTVENGTATSTGTSAVNTESADGTNDGTAAATDTATTTPAPFLRAQANGTPEAISTTSQTDYAHSATATQNGVTFTVSWNDAPAGAATTFHVTQTNGSSQAKARMDVPTYWDGGSQEASATRRARHGAATTAWAPQATTLPLTSRHRARTASTSTLWTTTDTTPKTTRGSTTCAPRRR